MKKHKTMKEKELPSKEGNFFAGLFDAECIAKNNENSFDFIWDKCYNIKCYEVKNKVTGNVKHDEINLGQIGKYSKLKDVTLNIDNISWKHFIKVNDSFVFHISDYTNQLLKEVDFVSMGVELNILRGKKALNVNIARISCPKNKLYDYWNC